MENGKEIIFIIKKIKKYNYKIFRPIIDRNYFEIIESEKWNQDIDFEKTKKDLIKFLNFIKNINLEFYDFVINRLNSNKNMNIKKIESLLKYQEEISIILFKVISRLEQNIKNKIIWFFSAKDNITFFDLINEIIKRERNGRFAYLRTRTQNNIRDNFIYDKKKNYLLLNEFGINDLIELFTILNQKRYKSNLKIVELLEDLFGQENFNNISKNEKNRNYYSPKSIWIVEWFIANLTILNKIRNKVMHNRVLFNDERPMHNIKISLKTIMNLSFENDEINKETINKVKKITYELFEKTNNDEVIKKFFTEKVLI